MKIYCQYQNLKIGTIETATSKLSTTLSLMKDKDSGGDILDGEEQRKKRRKKENKHHAQARKVLHWNFSTFVFQNYKPKMGGGCFI